MSKIALINEKLIDCCSVICVLSSPDVLQEQFSYSEYILFDGDDVIRKSLKYVPTPILLVCDTDCRIVKYHNPTGNDNVKKVYEELLRAVSNI